MVSINNIYNAIANDGFNKSTLHIINNYIKDIENGNSDFYRYNQPEHAGLCKAGSALIGAAIITSYARTSCSASRNAEEGERKPSNWEIDLQQEQLLEQWAKAADLWVDNADKILTETFGPMLAQGAEAKVYYREGDTSVIKERASIYSTTEKAFDAIVLHY